MEEIKKYLPGFDYEKLTDEQKEAVNEVFRILAEKYRTLDLSSLRVQFKLEDKKYYNLKEDDLYKRLKKNNIVVDTQGHIREGMGQDTMHYPLVTINCDFRQLQKVFNEFKKETAMAMGIEIKD